MLKPSLTHLCDNQDMMHKLGIPTQSGENYMSLVTDLTTQENLIRHNTRFGDLLLYPISVVTDGPMTAAHHIMRVWDTDDNGDMRYLIGYIRIDWNTNIVSYFRTWDSEYLEMLPETETSVMNKMRMVLQFMASGTYRMNSQYCARSTYRALNVPSFTGIA
jgi:hypothetical protein